MATRRYTYNVHQRYRDIYEWNPEPTVLQQLYHLTTVQVLKDINLDDVDNDVAWQYGQYYNTPWKSCHLAAEQFRSYHLPVLYSYILDKCVSAICETATYVTSILSLDTSAQAALIDLFNKHRMDSETVCDNFRNVRSMRPLPVTPAFVDQMDVVLATGKVMKNAAKPMGRIINDRFVGNLKLVCSQIEMLDKMAILTFNNIGNEQLVVSGEDSFLRQDQVRDLLEIVATLVDSTHMNVKSIANKDLHFDTIRTAGYILSTLLHLFYIADFRPEREEDLYLSTVASTNRYMKIVSAVREYTDKSLAYILRIPFHIFASGYCPQHPERRNAVRPYSLQERYLVLWYMNNINSIYT